MNTFGWLLLSGGCWLALVYAAPLADLPPQIVSLARSLYLGSFAIFMMMELRRTATAVPTGVRIAKRDLAWFAAPATAVLLLWLLSPAMELTADRLAGLAGFFALQLIALAMRYFRNAMRTGLWELLPPVLCGLLLSMATTSWIGLFLGVAGLLWITRHGAAPGKAVADALIMQLPSLCMAPFVLIALRDVFELTTSLQRTHMEALGMAVNGIGAALWTAIVMRSRHIAWIAVALWAAAAAGAWFLSQGLDVPLVEAIAALTVAELARGCLWLGLTGALAHMERWGGFFLNAAATALPVAALLVAQGSVDVHLVLPAYVLLHALVPTYILLTGELGRQRGSPG